MPFRLLLVVSCDGEKVDGLSNGGADDGMPPEVFAARSSADLHLLNSL